VLLEDLADLGHGAVAVVGHRLDEKQCAGRAGALVHDLFVCRALDLARAALDGPMIVSLGIDCPFASAMALRRRGLPPGSPPPMRAATVSSLMSFVKSLPRFASRAPFLCLIVAHFEWPLMIDSLAVPTASASRKSGPPFSEERAVVVVSLAGLASGQDQKPDGQRERRSP
jgi:hypothetical protein